MTNDYMYKLVKQLTFNSNLWHIGFGKSIWQKVAMVLNRRRSFLNNGLLITHYWGSFLAHAIGRKV